MDNLDAINIVNASNTELGLLIQSHLSDDSDDSFIKTLLDHIYEYANKGLTGVVFEEFGIKKDIQGLIKVIEKGQYSGLRSRLRKSKLPEALRVAEDLREHVKNYIIHTAYFNLTRKIASQYDVMHMYTFDLEFRYTLGYLFNIDEVVESFPFKFKNEHKLSQRLISERRSQISIMSQTIKEIERMNYYRFIELRDAGSFVAKAVQRDMFITTADAFAVRNKYGIRLGCPAQKEAKQILTAMYHSIVQNPSKQRHADHDMYIDVKEFEKRMNGIFGWVEG